LNITDSDHESGHSFHKTVMMMMMMIVVVMCLCWGNELSNVPVVLSFFGRSARVVIDMIKGCRGTVVVAAIALPHK
jgi:cytochrome b